MMMTRKEKNAYFTKLPDSVTYAALVYIGMFGAFTSKLREQMHQIRCMRIDLID